MADAPNEFSFRTREAAFSRFAREDFDLLIIGGGITGTATARDAATRGLKVALVERSDFASGTSSASSKLIHGGLRYLENFEFGLVFEALSERAFLLKAVPNMVRPLPFYWPVYKGDPHGRGVLEIGLWLYDLLALFRSPEFHRSLSKRKLLQEIPFLRDDGLKGGLRYFDASMWDDALAVETARAAHREGAAVVNYVEAVAPLRTDGRISGFRVRDVESGKEMEIRAQQTIVCAGPWTDELGAKLTAGWKPWLAPSKGVHLVFDLKRIPIPGAMVMSHPDDGRISFVIPRKDLGAGVVIVGTTDSPSADPDKVSIESGDVEYLMRLLDRYFPGLELKVSDILSAYVGVRPLVGASGGALQKVSREHHIEAGPPGTVIVAGGKYTTHRKMAEEIVDYSLKLRKREAKEGKCRPLSGAIGEPQTHIPVNPQATGTAIETSRRETAARGLAVPDELFSRFGAEAVDVLSLSKKSAQPAPDPAGFPALEGELRWTIRNEMALHLEDFYIRRVPLYLSRADHGLPWAESLSKVWAEERGLPADAAQSELLRLRAVIETRSAWKTARPNS